MKLSFEWDEEKAKANLKKHRVGFDEAATVFTDSFSLTIHDPDPQRMSNGISTSALLTKVECW